MEELETLESYLEDEGDLVDLENNEISGGIDLVLAGGVGSKIIMESGAEISDIAHLFAENSLVAAGGVSLLGVLAVSPKSMEYIGDGLIGAIGGTYNSTVGSVKEFSNGYKDGKRKADVEPEAEIWFQQSYEDLDEHLDPEVPELGILNLGPDLYKRAEVCLRSDPDAIKIENPLDYLDQEDIRTVVDEGDELFFTDRPTEVLEDEGLLDDYESVIGAETTEEDTTYFNIQFDNGTGVYGATN